MQHIANHAVLLQTFCSQSIVFYYWSIVILVAHMNIYRQDYANTIDLYNYLLIALFIK